MAVVTPTRPRPDPTDASSPTTALGRLARFVLRHRRLVIVFWLVVLVAGGMASGQVQKRLKLDFSLPGQPGYETAVRIQHVYGNGGDAPSSIIVVTAPPGQTVASNSGA